MTILSAGRGRHLFPAFVFTFRLCRECGDGIARSVAVAIKAAFFVVLR